MGAAVNWAAAAALVTAVASFCTFSTAAVATADFAGDGGNLERRSSGRVLLGIRETKGNTSFQCTPSGPCLPCQYSEKTDEKYHCSETGYRVPLKCIEIKEESKDGATKARRKLQDLDVEFREHLKQRNLLDDSSTSEGGSQVYVTYRSCLPVDGQEKLSILGFEVIIFGLLLVSGSFVYLRRKKVAVMPGASPVRIPTNSPRF